MPICLEELKVPVRILNSVTVFGPAFDSRSLAMLFNNGEALLTCHLSAYFVKYLQNCKTTSDESSTLSYFLPAHDMCRQVKD
jgi:hypothetical protein